MNKSEFQQEIRVTVECMKIIMRGPKGCVQLLSNNTYFSVSLFSVVKIMRRQAMR